MGTRTWDFAHDAALVLTPYNEPEYEYFPDHTRILRCKTYLAKAYYSWYYPCKLLPVRCPS